MGSVFSYFSSASPLSLPSPSPSPCFEIKYDVFLSFRGEDTRNNFTSHLFKAFRDKGIDAFIDYQLRSGDEISPSLLQAIEESQISIVIFSKSYVDSRWCLEELVKILECKKIHGQIVIPIFYEINPSDVRKQTGSFAAAFARHQKRFKEDLDRVQKWRHALEEAANVSGFDSRVVVPESVLVEKIVEDVLERLNRLNNMPSSDNKQLVGIESKITEIEVMLWMGDQTNDDIRKVGICGIGGIGKTTLAKAIFDKIYCQFEGYYFIGSVREASEKKELSRLRQELYSAIFGGRNAYIYAFTERRLNRKKLLIVFDDVTSFEQIEYLFRDLDCFRSGSRIIITSRNRQVLKNCAVNDIYEVEELCFNDSLKLFCWHAFKQNRPNVEYKELSKGIVRKVGGVPLALKVLGSFLLGKRKEVWESSIKRLENILNKDVHEVLKISYDGLDPDQQRIFLDIACFYKGWDVNLVKAIMEASPEIFIADGLSVLEDTCLIIILDNRLMMHDLLQAMGKTIVQQESINPGKRTRLYNHNDIYDVLTNATGTKKIEGISLDMSTTKDIHLHSDAFVNMRNLRFLQFYISDYLDNNKVHVPQDLKFPLTKLRYFEWKKCPLKSLLSNSYLENLVILQLCDSNIEQLWSDVQQFNHLKRINLERSQNLIRFPDLRAPKLESLNLNDCASLIEMPSSFQHLSRLMNLHLFSCEYLTSVPQLPKSLKLLGLSGCSKLRRLPELPSNLKDLYLIECSSLFEIPSSIQHLTRLSSLDLWGCENLTSIPDCTGLISLRHLEISNCSKLERLPEIPNNFEQIKLEGCTSLFEIPSSFKCLNKLKRLTFEGCESLTSIPNLTGLKSLTFLTIERWSKLKVLPKFPKSIQALHLKKISIEELPPSLLHNLRELSLIECGITEIPDSVCCSTSLEILDLDGNNFERLPESIINLSNLWWLKIRHCERLRVLPKLPWADVDARNCKSLQEFSCPSFPNDFFASERIRYMQFINCFKLDRNSLDNFVKDTQREIKAQSPSYRQVYEGKNPPPLNICYPGNEIPEWFDFQSNGSFIDVKLPLDWINYNFLCFALCAVVSFPDQFELQNNLLDSNSVYVTYECYVKSKEGGHNWNRMNCLLGGFYNSDYSMRSSHVIIGFGFHFFRELYDNEFTFTFYGPCKMEKCGVHLIFGKQLEKLDQNEEVDELHGEESKEDDEPHLEEFNDEDEPHAKRLKHI